MNARWGAIERASRDLATLERGWALVGGLAVSVRTEPRFTRDVDLAKLASASRLGPI